MNNAIDKSSIENLKQRVKNKLDSTQLFTYRGSVSKLLGLTVEVKLPGLKIGDLCYIETYDGRQKPAEVQAFKGEVAQLSLLLDGEGIGQGSLVTSTGKPIIILILWAIPLMGNRLIWKMQSTDRLKGLRRGRLNARLLPNNFQQESERLTDV